MLAPVRSRNEVQVDSREFFTGPSEALWSRAKVGAIEAAPGGKVEVDVVPLVDLYGSGKTIVASIFGENPRRYLSDSYSWVRFRDGSSEIALVGSNCVQGMRNREEAGL